MIIAKERHRTIDIMTLFSWFIIYSFIGWVYETAYCSITTNKLANRGFLNGPLLPIYGWTILAMILIISDRCKNIVSLFLSCSIVATVMEYIISYSFELVFHRRWWNYYGKFLNIDGRVCLGASLIFGLCGVLVIRFLHPAIIKHINRGIPEKYLRLTCTIVFILLMCDTLVCLQKYL